MVANHERGGYRSEPTAGNASVYRMLGNVAMWAEVAGQSIIDPQRTVYVPFCAILDRRSHQQQQLMSRDGKFPIAYTPQWSEILAPSVAKRDNKNKRRFSSSLNLCQSLVFLR